MDNTNLKVEKWTLEDGRRAERRVVEDGSDTIIEVHVEDERPLRLTQRIVETKKPVIVERKIETVDPKTGQVVDQKLESLEPKVGMQLREHIAKAAECADSCCGGKSLDTDALVEALSAVIHQTKSPVVKSLGLAEELESEEKVKNNWLDKLLWAVIGLQVVAVVYVLFFR